MLTNYNYTKGIERNYISILHINNNYLYQLLLYRVSKESLEFTPLAICVYKTPGFFSECVVGETTAESPYGHSTLAVRNSTSSRAGTESLSLSLSLSIYLSIYIYIYFFYEETRRDAAVRLEAKETTLRKGTRVVDTNGVTATFYVFDGETERFVGIPVSFIFQKCQGVPFSNPARFITFAAAPLLVLTPFVRNQTLRGESKVLKWLSTARFGAWGSKRQHLYRALISSVLFQTSDK